MRDPALIAEILKIANEDCVTRVKVLPAVKKCELIRLYSEAKILLHPSIYEGLPYVALEAQAVGLPIVASTAVPPEAVIHGVTGFRVSDPQDVHTFAKYVEMLLNDDNLWKRLSIAARRHAEELDCKKAALKYLSLCNGT